MLFTLIFFSLLSFVQFTQTSSDYDRKFHCTQIIAEKLTSHFKNMCGLKVFVAHF